MKAKSVLITNDLAIYKQDDIARTELVLSITHDGKYFHIAKNRFGHVSNGGPGIPIHILPQVIDNPEGMLVFDWK